jgi:hypothetical protein
MRRKSSDRYHDVDMMSLACNDTDFKAVHPDGYSCWHFSAKHCGNYDGLDFSSDFVLRMRRRSSDCNHDDDTMSLACNDADF